MKIFVVRVLHTYYSNFQRAFRGANLGKSKICNLLFIGAGASYGARANSNPPPLGPDLLSWLRDKSEYLLSIRGLHQERNVVVDGNKILNSNLRETDYEKFISSLSSDDRGNLHRLIQVMFSDLGIRDGSINIGFKSYEDGYDNLIKKHKMDEESWMVISLNYDDLLEQALTRHGLKYVYPYFPVANEVNTPGIRIYKPHGCIRFSAQPDDIAITHSLDEVPEFGKPTQFTFRSDHAIPNLGLVYSVPEGTENIVGQSITKTVYPVMANYTAGKTVDVNDQTLENVRDEALIRCEEIKNCKSLVIGVRPIFDRDDDPFVTQLLHIQFSNITYVTFGEKDTSNFRSKFPNAEIHSQGLQIYLDQ